MTDKFDEIWGEAINQYPQWFQDKMRKSHEMWKKLQQGDPEAEAYFRAARQLEYDIIHGTNRSKPMEKDTFTEIWNRSRNRERPDSQ